MRFRNFLLGAILFAALTGCNNDEVDLINIEVKDDLSTSVQIVVSPVDTNEEDNDFTLTEEERKEEEERQAEYFSTKQKEFESCGFTARRNLRYDEDGVSGSQSFSSRTELEESFSCLSFVTSQVSPIDLNYPSKAENILQEKYQLRLGVQNPNVLFGYGGFLGNPKPVKEIRVSLPGRIGDISTEDQSSDLVLNKSESESGILEISIDGVDIPDSGMESARRLKIFFDKLEIDTADFDYNRLYSESTDEFNAEALDELFERFTLHTGIDYEDSEAFNAYVNQRIPLYTVIVINSTKSKIDTGTAVTIFLGLFPFAIGFLVFLYKNRNKKLKRKTYPNTTLQ